jgi:hypothetical protein
MPLVEFEPTIPAFEREKTVHDAITATEEKDDRLLKQKRHTMKYE